MSKKIRQYVRDLETLDSFFCNFGAKGSREKLHLMYRAAFARVNGLTKRDVLELLFFREQMLEFIAACHRLSRYDPNKLLLRKYFKWRNREQWAGIIQDTFYAAVGDGFAVRPPKEKDMYHACRALHCMIAASLKIFDRDRNMLFEKAD